MTDSDTHGDHYNLNMLLSLPLFAQVPQDLLASVLTQDAIRYYQDGEMMLVQGGPANCLLILLHG